MTFCVQVSNLIGLVTHDDKGWDALPLSKLSHPWLLRVVSQIRAGPYSQFQHILDAQPIPDQELGALRSGRCHAHQTFRNCEYLLEQRPAHYPREEV